MTSLLNMPKDVMDVIIKDFECKSIFDLRKVCRGLRDYIDKVKPDIKLTGIQVKFYSEKLTFAYKLDQEYDTIQYQKHGESFLIKKKETGLKLEANQDFIELFFKHLKWILDFQKSILEDVSLKLRHYISGEANTPEFRRSLESLKNILESRKTPIQVRKVFIQTKTQSEIMSILPYLDSKSLKTFEVSWPGYNLALETMMRGRSDKIILEMNEIWKLEHWNTIEEMSFGNLRTTESLMNFVHFTKFEVHVESISMEELVLLKETFQKPSKMENFKFTCSAYIANYLMTSFGYPYAGRQTKKWFFRIPNNSNQILQLTNDYSYEFQYIDPSEVSPGAVIQD